MCNLDENAVIERIKGLRKQYAGNRGRSEFARALGVSPSTYSYYENNRIPPPQILLKICEITGADLEWLLTGHSSQKKSSSGPNTELLRRLDKLLTENPEMSEVVSAFVELLCEKRGLEAQLHARVPPPGSARPGWIPVLGRTAAGIVHFWDQELLPEPKQAVTELDEIVKKHLGKEIVGSADGTISVDLQAKALLENVKENRANLIQVCGQPPNGSVGGRQSGEIVEFVQCEQLHRLFPDSFGLRIDGDSMSPRINDGDIVILSPSVPAAQGHIAVARIANQIGVTCKLVRTTESGVHLIPINEKYDTKVVAKKDLLWALAVLCHIRI